MKLLNKIYYKNKITFTLIWIFIYILGFSFGDYLSSLININKLFTLIIEIFLSLILLLFLKKNNLFTTYGLNKTNISSRYMLLYIPCIIMLSSNMMFGVTLLYSPLETILYILSMFCVGF